MTLLEVAKHALEAMEDAMYRADTHEFYDAKESLRYAIEQAEQVKQEPVAWLATDCIGERYLCFSPPLDNDQVLPLYAATPQRKPLKEEEILKAVGWDRAEMYMKLTPNFPVAEAKKETLKNARAIERAHGIGG